MKVITITEKNIKDVYARLRKFFYNNNNTGFVSWHNFDTGFKKRISRYITIAGKKIPIQHYYPSPIAVMLSERWMTVSLVSGEGFMLSIGDKIAFVSNRIIYRKKWDYGGNNYLYTVFQVLPMTKEEQDRRRRVSELVDMEFYYDRNREEYDV